MSGRWLSRVFFVAALVLLLAGLHKLIHLRFESGRAYAPLSSLRTDPLGAKALHDAFETVDGLSVARNFVPLDQVHELEPEASLLVLNTGGYAMFGLSEYRALREFVQDGGRLVIALDAANVAYEYLDQEGELIEAEESDPEDDDAEEPVRFTRGPLDDEWGIWAGLVLRHGEHKGGPATRAESGSLQLPGELPWREGGVLEEFDESIWAPVYYIGDEVVAASREFGEGSIVVMTDSYLFSNEAMLRHRYPGLLTWVIGGHRRVVFEETHLGVSERTGIAVLMRRYGLFEFVFAFACFMLLVVWRGSQPLLPTYSHISKANLVETERSVESGFCDLVGRHMRGSDLATQAFGIWKSSFVRSKTDEVRYAKELSEIQSLLEEDRDAATRKRRPADTHSQIKSILNRKRRKHL